MFIIVNKVVKYRITGDYLVFFDYLCSTNRLNATPIQKWLTLNNLQLCIFQKKIARNFL